MYYMKIVYGKLGEVFNMKSKNEIPMYMQVFWNLVFEKLKNVYETVICLRIFDSSILYIKIY